MHSAYSIFFFLCNTGGNRLFLFWFWLVLNKQSIFDLERILYLLFSLIVNIRIKSASRLVFVNPDTSFLVFYVCWWLTQSRGTMKVSCSVICKTCIGGFLNTSNLFLRWVAYFSPLQKKRPLKRCGIQGCLYYLCQAQLGLDLLLHIGYPYFFPVDYQVFLAIAGSSLHHPWDAP